MNNKLIVNGAQINVAGNFSTTEAANGVLQMQFPTDTVNVAGDATFAGNDETGLLTNGLLVIQGGLIAEIADPTFYAVAPHVTRFTGDASSVNFPSGQGDAFGNLEIGTMATPASLQFQTAVTINGDARINNGTVTSR